MLAPVESPSESQWSYRQSVCAVVYDVVYPLPITRFRRDGALSPINGKGQVLEKERAQTGKSAVQGVDARLESLRYKDIT